MTTLTQLCQMQQVLRGQLDKFIENGKKTAIVKRTQGFYELKIAGLNAIWEEFRKNDFEINKAALQVPPKVPEEYLEQDKYSEAEIKYTDYMAELMDGLRKVTTCSITAPVVMQAPGIPAAHDIQLPRITLPKYNGNYDLWRSFHDVFVSLVHNNPKLAPVQKLHYLKECLVGEAEALLRHIPTTNQDYEPAWAKLKEQYENKRVLVNHQLKTFMNIPKLSTETAKGLKVLINTTSECLQQLKGLEVDTSSWDVILIYLLVQRLPFTTLRLWEEEQGTTQALPTYAAFHAFLNNRLRVLESIADAVTSKPAAELKAIISKGNTHSHHTRKQNNCPACQNRHFVITCKKYRSMSPETRYKVLKAAGHCLNCLSTNHETNACPSKYRCQKCKQKHNTTLHTDVRQENIGSSSSKEGHLHEGMSKDSHSPATMKTQSVNCNDGLNSIQSFLATKNHHALLSTALVTAHTDHGRRKTLRCLIDTGSESSFITEAACKQLGAIATNTAIAITGLSASPAATAHKKVRITLRACSPNSASVADEFLVLNQITDPLPTKVVRKGNWNHLKNLRLADPTFWKPGDIDALLGARIYAKIVQAGIRRGPDTAPTAINTIFGWILIGSSTSTHVNQVRAHMATTTHMDISNQLKQFWELEEVPTQQILNQEDEICQRIFKETHVRKSNGKYQVNLPFVQNTIPTLGESRPQALKRFKSLQLQFSKNPQFEEDYKKCLDEYIELDHMEAVNPPSDEEEHYYIPHHAVVKQSTTTKLRVVFDASAKTTTGNSLNECLLTGPTLQPKLFATLLNWRKYKVAINADIEKMYRMIEVHPDHRTFQRIIWRHPQTGNLQDYKLKTVTFGTACAPYLAIRTLQQLAEDERQTWPLASKAIYSNFYVDDLLAGADNTNDAKLLQAELTSLTKAGGFNLRKWTSNDSALLKDLPVEHRELKDVLTFAVDDAVKTLGIRWHPGPDHFTFTVNPMREHNVITKRNMLSNIASLYDPLGWLSPVIVVAKILMQSLWITGNAWDTQVSPQIAAQWCTCKRQLKALEELQIPRWIHYSPNVNAQLHGFCDASARAYAAVLYLRIEREDGEITSTLLTSKTKIAPIKPTTIPRLELNGAVILARLMKTTIEDMEFQHIPTFAWTGSTIALQWVKEHPSKWKTYVANRVVEIQDVLRYDQWRHIPTKDNPADLASRGIPASNLIGNRLWWHGPSWLTCDQEQWPKFRDIKEQTDLEAKTPKVINFLTQVEGNILLRYSTMTRLTRVIALILRFKYNCLNPKNKRQGCISVFEWQEAEYTILRLVQMSSFPEEYTNLANGKSLMRNSRLLKLNPFMDRNKLIRVGGRLQNATILYTAKHPIILPQEHFITQLIIDRIHLGTLHGGTSLVLSTSRQKYWILNARRCIASRLHKCTICARQRGATATQLMGQLPAPRVNIDKPFSNVGIDYAGPITIKSSTLRNAKLLKAYICVIICLATRAVHIELVSDLSTAAFIAALRRFIARRGLCSNIYSDCGTNFIGASIILDKELKLAIQEATSAAAQYFIPEQIVWHFNPPAAPHFGGLWEAGVRSIKHHLRRTVGKSTYTFEEYATILTQIEACLNSRPLCCVRNDPDDPVILTPGHFLIGQALNAIPEPSSSDAISFARRWKHIQHAVKGFWDKWTRDYLNQLQQRQKWCQEQHNIQVGDIVLIKHETMPPTKWPLGIIERTFPGPDGLIRVVQIRTAHNTFQRPITKLCPLPIERSTPTNDATSP